MMKLLKYDIKQNANTVLGLFAVLVILQVLLSITGNLRQWDAETIFGLSLILYFTAVIFMLVQSCKTFAYNIKAYHRRLLPLHPVWTILSSLVFSWLVALIIGAIVLIHAAIYYRVAQVQIDFVQIGTTGFGNTVLIILSIVWMYTLLVLTIFMAITIGASVSIRGKAGTWVGIISFFVIQNGMSWVEGLLFKGTNSTFANFGIIQIGMVEENGAVTRESVNLLPLGPFLLEVVVAVLMFYAITYLLKKRIEI